MKKLKTAKKIFLIVVIFLIVSLACNSWNRQIYDIQLRDGTTTSICADYFNGNSADGISFHKDGKIIVYYPSNSIAKLTPTEKKCQ
jgi:hypothetical protein